MLIKSKLQIIVLINLVLIAGLTLGCQVKKFDSTNSFVCVCNDQYCDSLDAGPFSVPETLTIYKSDRDYYRLSKSVFPESILTAEDSHDIHVTLNMSDRLQSIIGFGGAFTDASGININRLKSSALRDRLMVDYFGPNGAEYNLARVPIGGSDFSDRPYSYDDVVDDFELTNFALAKDDFEYKIPFIKQAQSLNSNLKLFGSPWAPPAWLKTNNDSKGLGILIGEPGSLHWKTWANYFIKFFESYKENGVEFWGLTPQNEPLTGLEPGYRWNTLGFSSAMMREFIKQDLGPALNASGYGPDKIKLIIYDHNTNELFPFTRGVLSDPEAASYVSGVAYHWYSGHYYEELTKVHDNYPDYFIISTEACEGWTRPDLGVSLGNWTRAETYAADIIEGLNRWSTGWVDWNLVLDPQGAPNWAANYVDAPVIVSDDGTEYYKQPMYYSMAHFSKFLKPGSQRVNHHIDESKVDGVLMTAFVTPANELTMVVVNTNESPIKMTFNGVGQSKFTLTVGARSIQTVVKPL